MPPSLKTKFTGKEAEVLKTINDCGIGGAMELYGIKTRPIFVQWVRENTNGEWKPGPLAGLSGGNKDKLIREHRETILDCVEIFGMEWVKDNFGFARHDTLERFIRFNGKPFTEKLTRLERVELDNRDIKARIAKLEKQMELIDTRFEKVNENYMSSGRVFREHMNQHDGTVEAISQRLSQIVSLGLRGYIEPLQRTDPLNITELVAQAKPHLPEQLNNSEEEATEPVAHTSVEIIQPASSIEAPPRALKEAYMAAHPFAKSQALVRGK